MVGKIVQANSAEDVWSYHGEHMREFGFDRLLYTSTRFRMHGLFGDIADAIMLSSHHPDFLKAFDGTDLYIHSPTTSWLQKNVGALSWQVAWDRFASSDLTEGEKRVKELYKQWDITAGYTISLNRVDDRSLCTMGLCGERGLSQGALDAIWKESGETIILLNNIMHLKMLALPQLGQRRTLTPRQREVLQWVADGKTVQDIADIMSLKPSTVEKHLRLARAALNVETTAQAVLKASLRNQLFLLNKFDLPATFNQPDTSSE